MARPKHSGFQADVTCPKTGKRYRPSGFKTSVAAEAWEHLAMANLLVGKPVPPGPAEAENASDWTLKQMLDHCYQERWASSGDPSYFEKQIAVLIQDLGPDYPAADLNGPAGFATIKEKCEARRNSAATINKKISLISTALKVAIDKGKLQNMLKPQFERVKGGTKTRERILSRDEELACLSWARQCAPDFADWIVVGIDTGFRSYSEGLHIYPFADVRGKDLFIRGRLVGELGAANVVDLAQARRRTKTGEGKSRMVGLTARALAVIEERKRKLHNTPSATLFPELTKQRITDLWRMMKDALKITDPDFVPYSLRHTFGTRCILAGVSVPDLSVLMGHSTIKQTWKYVHLAGLVQTGAASKLEAYLNGGDK